MRSLEDAAERFVNDYWFKDDINNDPNISGVGIGDGEIIVYLKSDIQKQYPEEYEGWPLTIFTTGQAEPNG